MFHHHRLRPHVHAFRLRGNRIVRHVALGGALIVFGIAHLLHRQGLISAHELWLIAPALLVLSGLARLIAAPGAASVVHAIVHLAIAAYLVIVIEQVGGWTLAATWPVLLIAVGVANVAHGLFNRRLRAGADW